MSIRIHVVGAYQAAEDQLRDALNQIGDQGSGSQRFRIGSSGDWAWANASVWHVGGHEINEAIGTLPVPALRVTSSDGVLWMLTLTSPGKNRFHGMHHFTQVGMKPPTAPLPAVDQDEDFPEDELEEVAGINKFDPELQFLWDDEEEQRLLKLWAEESLATIPGLDDYTDYGVTLPQAAIEQMKLLPHQAYYIAFMAHGAQIVDALEEFGFPFDREAMLQLLTVGPLTDPENDSDVGNMPRFLEMLGITGVFQEPAEFEDEFEDGDLAEEVDESGPVDWSDYPPGELLEQVSPLMAECKLAEIAGGPVKPTHGALLNLFAHLVSDSPTTVISLEFPDASFQPSPAWEQLGDLEVIHNGTKWQAGFVTFSHQWYGIGSWQDLASNELALALAELPDGTRIEMTFVVNGLAEHCHRYAGQCRDQRIELEQVYPPVSAGELDEMLTLMERIFDSKSIELLSEEETETVRRDYQRSQGQIPKIRNRKIMPESGSRDCVVRSLLMDRFKNRGPWDMIGARKQFEEQWEQYSEFAESDDDENDELVDIDSELAETLQQMSESMEQFNQAKAVPHHDEVVFTGRTGQFFSASMADLENVSQASLDQLDSTMAALGLRSVGDFVGDADQRQEMTRCYAGHPLAVALHGRRNGNHEFDWVGTSDGAALVDFSQGTVEFHTHFEDGTSLATTSIEAVTSRPTSGIYVRYYEDLPVDVLWEKHLDGVERFKEHRQTVPVDHTEFTEPEAFLAKIDQFLGRFIDAN